MKYHELPPNAGRVINSLRDSGYDFNTAVSDIVDNSIAAGATEVKIVAQCSKTTGEIKVAICDNGCGMGIDELCNAMTYGSSVREDVHSLGKFGLGLKTASTSQCRRVSLISRNVDHGEVSKLYLDIDHTEKVKSWEYIEDDPTPADVRYLHTIAGGGTGTVVLWEKCDRILGRKYKDPGGRAQRAAFEKKLDELRFHLGIVFQRFLDADDNRARDVKITVRSEDVLPFDPFAEAMSQTTLFSEEEYDIDWEDERENDSLSVRAFIVPSRSELKHEEEIEAVFPPSINPDSMQGFYVYRENRLIHWGDWCGLYKSEFHNRLCRIELSFDALLDDCFKVDYQKSKIEIADFLAKTFQSDFLPEYRAEGALRYRRGSTQQAVERAHEAHSKSNASIAKKEKNEKKPSFSARENPDTGLREVISTKGRSFIEVIDRAATDGPKVNIRPVERLADDSLWKAGIFDDNGRLRTYVEINSSHPFYQKALYACKGNANALRCVDFLIWSLAEAEYATKDAGAMDNYGDMILEVSRNLRLLSDDLPADEK